MLNWAIRYLPALILVALLIAILDGVVSSLMTCHPISNAVNQTVGQQQHQECTALAGPTLLILEWVIYFLDKHGEAVVAAFTAILATFTGRLWWSTNKLWKATTEASKAQLDDTRILQRAYLGVIPRGIDLYRSADGRLSCDVSFVNSGNLPARNVSWVIDRKFCTDPRLNDFPIDESKFDGNNLILPHGEIRKGGPWINSAELDAFRHRQQGIPDSCWLYVWGSVRYMDGFNRKRFVDFCYRYHLAGTTWAIDEKEGRQHESGNRTDEDQG